VRYGRLDTSRAVVLGSPIVFLAIGVVLCLRFTVYVDECGSVFVSLEFP
jgi:hypothetical protein